MSIEAIAAALAKENELNCSPPKTTRQVEQIVRSIERYPRASYGQVGWRSR
jgi:hypothetical protein